MKVVQIQIWSIFGLKPSRGPRAKLQAPNHSIEKVLGVGGASSGGWPQSQDLTSDFTDSQDLARTDQRFHGVRSWPELTRDFESQDLARTDQRLHRLTGSDQRLHGLAGSGQN